MAMGSPWIHTWLVCSGLLLALAGGHSSNSTFATPSPDDRSKSLALGVEDRQDYGSYYPSYATPSPGAYGPPPVYGPPPPTIPEGMVHIEFAFDEIVLRCISEEPFEHVAWIRYPCPQQFMFGGEGEHVADGSSVYQPDLYDVHVRAHDGSVVTELLIKRPLAENSEGIYQCEAWPHVHGGGGYTSYDQATYQAPKSNIFIIGGDSLLEHCYHVSSYAHGSNKLHGIDNKQGANDIKLKTNLNMITFKPRRNNTDERNDSNSKQLRYNLKYVDNALYNVDGTNVTAKFFRPINRTFTGSLGLSENFVNTSNWN